MKSALKNALPIIASALGEKLGVTVEMGGRQACTDGRKVKLPSLSMDDKDSQIMALAYVEHEAAHLRYSDFTLQFPTPLAQMIDNLLEDIRIEHNLAIAFPGTKDDLSKLVTLMTQKGLTGDPMGFCIPKAEMTPTQLMQAYMLYKLRHDVLGQAGVKPLLDIAEDLIQKVVPAGMQIRLEALMFEVTRCESEQDVLDLTMEIIRMMEEEAQKEREKEQQQQQQDQSPQQGNGGQGQDQSGQGAEGETQQQSGAGESSQDQGEEGSEGQHSSGQSGQDQGGQGQGQSQPSSEGSSEPATGAGGKGAGGGASTIEQMLNATSGEAMADLDQLLEGALQAKADTHSPSSVRIALSQRLSARHSSNAAAETARVAAQSNALRVRAQALLQAQTIAQITPAMMGRKLNMKGLHNAKLGGPVFQRKTEGVQLDTAVMILIDRSGSMSNNIGLALDTTLASTVALQMPGIRTAVAAFPFDIREDQEGAALLKDFDESPQSAVGTFQMVTADGGTPLSSPLMYCGMRLLREREPRKIILVMTDGHPNGGDRPKSEYAIDLLRKAGIEVFGLGIGCDTTQLFGPESRMIETIDQLPSAMIGMLQKALTAKLAA